jgi:hypothetical protein
MTDERRALAERLASTPGRLATAARRARDEPPAPGEWTPSDVVRHLIAVEQLVWHARLADLATHDHPTWPWTEPDRWSGEPGASLDQLLATYESVRVSTVAMLGTLDDDAWARSGTHATYGELDVAGLMNLAVDHDEEHLRSFAEEPGATRRTMDSHERAALIARYRTGAAEVVDALAGITEEELDRTPADPSEWTARQVIHHVADSETMAYIRLRRLIAEDQPLIAGYEEPEWARRLHYERPIGSSVAVVVAVRGASLELLEHLTPGEWRRRGTHTESGAYDVASWLRVYADHPHDHAAQIRAARRAAPVS